MTAQLALLGEETARLLVVTPNASIDACQYYTVQY